MAANAYTKSINARGRHRPDLQRIQFIPTNPPPSLRTHQPHSEANHFHLQHGPDLQPALQPHLASITGINTMDSWCHDSSYNLDPMLDYSQPFHDDQAGQDDHLFPFQTSEAAMYPSSPLEGRRLSAFGANIDFDEDTQQSSLAHTIEPSPSRSARYQGHLPYSELIWRCLRESPNNEISLKGLYAWFSENTDRDWSALEAGVELETSKGKGTEKGKSLRKGWQCSVRHNLSMNNAFSKHESRKGVWVLNPLNHDGVESTTRFRRRRGRSASPDRSYSCGAPSRERSGSSLERAETTRDRRKAAGRRGGVASRHGAAVRHENKLRTRKAHAAAGHITCTPSEDFDMDFTPTPSPRPTTRSGARGKGRATNEAQCNGPSYTSHGYNGMEQQRQAHPYYTPSPSLSGRSMATPQISYASVRSPANGYLMTPPPNDAYGTMGDYYMTPNYAPQDLQFMGSGFGYTTPFDDSAMSMDQFCNSNTLDNTAYPAFTIDVCMQNQNQNQPENFGYSTTLNPTMLTPSPGPTHHNHNHNHNHNPHAHQSSVNPYAPHTPSTLSRQVSSLAIDPALEQDTQGTQGKSADGAGVVVGDMELCGEMGTDLDFSDAMIFDEGDFVDFKGCEVEGGS